MKMDNVQINTRNILFYLLGCMLIAFGVVLMTKSNVGNSSWDTLHWSLHSLFGFTMGVATILVASLFTILVIAINKEYAYLFMFVPIFLVGLEIDLFTTLLQSVEFTHIILKIIIFIIGSLMLPLGGSMLIISTFPAGIFDEVNLTLMRLFKTNKLALVRVIMELLAVTTAIIIGFIAGIKFGKVNIGTLIFSVTVGFMLKTYLKVWAKFGIYDTSQIEESKNIQMEEL